MSYKMFIYWLDRREAWLSFLPSGKTKYTNRITKNCKCNWDMKLKYGSNKRTLPRLSKRNYFSRYLSGCPHLAREGLKPNLGRKPLWKQRHRESCGKCLFFWWQRCFTKPRIIQTSIVFLLFFFPSYTLLQQTFSNGIRNKFPYT